MKRWESMVNNNGARLSIFDVVCLSILFIPYLFIDLFNAAISTTEWEKRGVVNG